MSKPLVSIIIRTRNRPHLLREALVSVSKQTYDCIEVVVVNDGGCDVVPVLDDFKQRINITYIHVNPPKGRVHAANAGLDAAKGEWTGFLDDDDLLIPHAVEKLINYASASGVAYGIVEAVLLQSDGTWKTVTTYGRSFSREALVLCNYIPICGLLFRTELAKSIGGFDEEFELLEDWDFIYRLSRVADFVFLPEKVATYRLFGRGYVLDAHNERLKEYPWRLRFYAKHLKSITPHDLTKGFYDFLEVQEHLLQEERRLRTEAEIQLQGILNSKLWKITTPIRELKSRIRRILQ